MISRNLNIIPAWCLTAALALTSCSSPTSPAPETPEPKQETPSSYPPIPRPSSPNEIIPDESEVYSEIVSIEGRNVDFAPTWKAGVFSWDTDIQTQYDKYIGGWSGDEPGNYWNGTRHNSGLVFEGGNVDLRSPTAYGTSWGDPDPKRVLFVEDGLTLATRRNPDIDGTTFIFTAGYPQKFIKGALWGGYKTLAVDPLFGERERRRVYYVAATACPPLTNPVHIKRDRFWVRLPLGGDGNNLKSIRVDPGSTFEVSYTRTQGTSYTSSYQFTQTINAEVAVQAPKQVVGAKLGGSLSEAFGTSVGITEESSVTVTKTMTGREGKTVIYSVWASVERYVFVDADGNAYTDPNFTFNELGSAEIKGEYEWISSTAFDYE
jgi:hypothetical protein